jgi:uncharacterized protein YprB with RNaseH-like and TPR domain
LPFDGDTTRLDEFSGGERWRDLDLERCLFLDTETMGLAGTGALVFLCGIAFFDGDALAAEQVFLRAFGEEPAALAHIEARLQERPFLVTYVGKSFDRHRLACRMAVHRIDTAMLVCRHLDLYHAARRRWRGTIPDCRLQTVERHVLGLERDDDLPGALAPAVYLDWLRDSRGPIDRVFEHNRLDVLSLVTLLGAMCG